MSGPIQGFELPETLPNRPVIVHCDASHNPTNSIATAGFMFTFSNGEPIGIISQNLGAGYTTNGAEKEAITRALSMIDNYSPAEHVRVYSDSKVAVTNLRDRDLETGSLDTVELQWTSRESNTVADAVAESGKEEYPHQLERPKYGICD